MVIKNITKLILPVFFFIAIDAAYAGLGDDMSGFLNALNMSSNTTGAGAYHGQSIHQYSGGTNYIRTQTKNVQFVNVQIPSVNGGCQGIDIFKGGMGYLDADEILDYLRSIGANATGYMFSLMMKQISPQIMGTIQEWAALINDHAANLRNSCYDAMKLVDSGIGMAQSAMNIICIKNYLQTHQGSTRTEAVKHCQDQRNVNNGVNEAKGNRDTETEAIHSSVNVTWYAMSKSPILKDLDVQTKYMLMTIIGTIIVDKTEHEPRIGKLDMNLLQDINLGKRVKLYTCRDNADAMGCLNVAETDLEIGEEKSFYGIIKAQLEQIETDIIEDTPVKVNPNDKSSGYKIETEKLKSFLDVQVIPVYQILNVYAATAQGQRAPITVSEYSELIAMDVLYKFVNQGVYDVSQSISSTLLTEKHKNEISDMVSKASARIKDMQKEHVARLRTTNEIVLKVRMLEKQIFANASNGLVGNLNFRRGNNHGNI